MTLEDAIKLAEDFRGAEISGIMDCGDRWAFGFKIDDGCLGSAPVFVFKEDGRCEYFFIGENLALLRTGVKVELPKEDA